MEKTEEYYQTLKTRESFLRKYFHQTNITESDYDSLTSYEKLIVAENGNLECAYLIASPYYDIFAYNGVEFTLEDRAKLMKLSADGDFGPALFEVGEYYLYGQIDGYPRDLDKAREYYERSLKAKKISYSVDHISRAALALARLYTSTSGDRCLEDNEQKYVYYLELGLRPTNKSGARELLIYYGNKQDRINFDRVYQYMLDHHLGLESILKVIKKHHFGDEE